jgi:signal transduction histidine kinase
LSQAVEEGAFSHDAGPHAGSGATGPAPRAEACGASVPEHFVQFYESDAALLESLEEFIGGGLLAGESCVVVATRPHVEGLEARLASLGLDLAAARAAGRYAALDADETLKKITAGGRPDRARFEDVAGGLVARAAEGGRGVRVFGEMVALLCARGGYEEAVELEELWNGLAARHTFTLMCAYPLESFGGESLAGRLSEVCAGHARVVPAESYTSLECPDERLRAIVHLQQKARSLRAEIEERTRAEESLRAVKEELEVRLAEREQLLAREQAMRAAAEEASRAKDEFLAAVSHELRTPLTAISGWTHMLRTGLLDEEASARALATIERNAHLQTQIIEDLLDASRIVMGKLRMDVQPVDLSPLVTSAVESVWPAAEAKGVRLREAKDAGVIAVAGDPERLQQVVWNLLSNAVKFTPRGGLVEVRLAREGDWAEVAVADDGEGIAPEFLPHVFERFRQADMSTTRPHGGLGLGLAIVRHLVELHGGSVRAESVGEGRGSTFVVRLPLAAGA